jgi:hypothetical protein
LVAAPKLSHVDLGGCGLVTDEGVRALAAAPLLASVDLSGCVVTDEGVRALKNAGAIVTR